MATKAEAKLLVIWAHEVRIAARMLRTVQAMLAVEDRTEAADKLAGKAMFDACQASLTALYGADDDEAVLVLCDAPEVLKPKRRKKGPTP